MYPNTRFDKPGKSPFMDMIWCRNMPMKRVLRLVCALTHSDAESGGENGYRHARAADFAQSFPANVSYNEYQYAIVQAAPPGLSTRCIRLPWAIKYKRHTASRPDHSRLGGSAE